MVSSSAIIESVFGVLVVSESVIIEPVFGGKLLLNSVIIESVFSDSMGAELIKFWTNCE